MRVYGNLTNRILEHSLPPAPEVGMGATLYAYTDRYAATVTAVSPSGKTATLVEDTVTKWKPWPSGYAETYAPNPNGRVFTARKGKNGTWKANGLGVTFGKRDAYSDPSF